MQGLRYQFFAGAALALDQDVHRAVANLVDQPDDRLNPVTHADDVLGGKPASVIFVEVSFVLPRALGSPTADQAGWSRLYRRREQPKFEESLRPRPRTGPLLC